MTPYDVVVRTSESVVARTTSKFKMSQCLGGGSGGA